MSAVRCAVDAAKGRSAARASIDQRRDYGAAPRAPAGGPLSKSAERSMREGLYISLCLCP